jgi:hypothetical protein
MRAAVAILSAILCLAGCNSKPTIGKLKKAHPEIATALTKGTDTAFAAILAAPNPEAGAKCEAPGSTKNSVKPLQDGDTEFLTLKGKFGASPGDADKYDFNGDGPAALWALRLRTEDSNTQLPDADAELQRAGKTKRLIVIRKTPGTRRDVFVVDLPAGTIACSYMFTAPPKPVPPPYDPATGEPFPEEERGGPVTAEEVRFEDAFEADLRKRFGVGQRDEPKPVAPPSKIQEDAKSRYSAMLAALDKADHPPCADPEPAGALRTTVLRLRAYAGAPPVKEDDPDFTMQPSALVSPDFQALVALVAPEKAAERDVVLGRLVAAPATIVVDIVKAKSAFRAPLSENGLTPGEATARAVRFDAAGMPVCQTTIEVKNPNEMTVTSRGYDIDLALFRAGNDDLRDQIVKALGPK